MSGYRVGDAHPPKDYAAHCYPQVVPVPATAEYELTADYSYSWMGREYHIGRGFRFDGASVPRFFWRVVTPFHPTLMRAALCHDHQYRSPYIPHRLKRKAADQMFRAFADEDGAPVVGAMYRAIRWGGGSSWRE